jgi:hypothetical protein
MFLNKKINKNNFENEKKNNNKTILEEKKQNKMEKNGKTTCGES